MSIEFFLRQNQNIKKLNILGACAHEAYQTGLAKTGHNFYCIRTNQVKDWDTKYRPLPENITLFPRDKLTLPSDIEWDLVFSQNKFGQIQLLEPYSKKLNIPLVNLEHTMPTWSGETNKHYINQAKKLRGDANVFISDYSKRLWDFPEGEVIHHGIDTTTFTDLNLERKPQILSVVNDFVNRSTICGFREWQEATKDLPVQSVGATPGFSEPAQSVEQLVEFYNTNLIFVNTSIMSPVPTSLMEAMACGACCVSFANCMIPEVITHNHDGLLCRNTQEMRHYLELCLKNPDLAQRLGQNARKTIQERFNLDTFVEKWNELFYRVVREWR